MVKLRPLRTVPSGQMDRGAAGLLEAAVASPALVTGVESLGSAERICAETENCRARGSSCRREMAARQHRVQSMVMAVEEEVVVMVGNYAWIRSGRRGS